MELSYYGEYGNLTGFGASHEQQQDFFAIDLNVSPKWFSFGRRKQQQEKSFSPRRH
jgi:hypothetical protein